MRAATGVPSVGRVVVGGRERAVGPADRAPGQAQAVEGLRAGDLVDEVQVDVEQAVGHLVGLPDLVEQRLWHVSSLSFTGADFYNWIAVVTLHRVRRRVGYDLTASQARGDDRQEGRLRGGGVLEVVGQVGVEGDAVALAQLVGAARRRQAGSRRARRARSRGCRARASADRPPRPVAPPGASVWRESSARWPGWAEVKTSKLCPRRLLPPRWRSSARTIVTAPVLVQAQQLREPQIEARGDPGGDGQRRARLAALDLGEHRRAHAAALGEVAQRQPRGLAQRLHARADHGGIELVAAATWPVSARDITVAIRAYVITDSWHSRVTTARAHPVPSERNTDRAMNDLDRCKQCPSHRWRPATRGASLLWHEHACNRDRQCRGAAQTAQGRGQALRAHRRTVASDVRRRLRARSRRCNRRLAVSATARVTQTALA